MIADLVPAEQIIDIGRQAHMQVFSKTRHPQSGEMEQVDKFAFLSSRALSPENWRQSVMF